MYIISNFYQHRAVVLSVAGEKYWKIPSFNTSRAEIPYS